MKEGFMKKFKYIPVMLISLFALSTPSFAHETFEANDETMTRLLGNIFLANKLVNDPKHLMYVEWNYRVASLADALANFNNDEVQYYDRSVKFTAFLDDRSQETRQYSCNFRVEVRSENVVQAELLNCTYKALNSQTLRLKPLPIY